MAHDPYQILAHPFSLEGYAVIITGAGGAIGGATAHVLAQAAAAEASRLRQRLALTTAELQKISERSHAHVCTRTCARIYGYLYIDLRAEVYTHMHT